MAHATKPTSRVLALLELLQSNRQLSGAELARSMGVEVRSVRRYITHLQELGVPVQAQRGRDGGYSLRPGHKLPPMMFSKDETLALAMGLRAARELGLNGILPALASAQAKLERVSPKALQRRLRDVVEAVALTPGQKSMPGSLLTEHLPALSTAARAQQRVRLRYRSGAQEQVTEAREVDVYGLAFRGGHWYAVGYCHLRQALRCFRLDRVEAVEARPASFLRPAGFDVLAHLSQAIATLPRAHTVRLSLHTNISTARAHLAPELGLLVPLHEGCRLDAQIDDLSAMAREIAAWPFACTIHKPQALRSELLALAQSLQSMAMSSGRLPSRPRASS
ncbi:helix-turn-helix transcriptional regulator [Roseateles koreensis]|uniref:YafY family protein n=1 Tax=Roseateles koreensis TaxID=2987526 RepID=A0ABT5KUI1_9BURK|nr:YafY family protein [Roseateles koreensis]MDC8786589.1 YafY family protein [Roseateles koreensis]